MVSLSCIPKTRDEQGRLAAVVARRAAAQNECGDTAFEHLGMISASRVAGTRFAQRQNGTLADALCEARASAEH